jgi:hypothetical protein
MTALHLEMKRSRSEGSRTVVLSKKRRREAA